MRDACGNKQSDLLEKLLKNGFNPKNLEDRGTSLILSLLEGMSWYYNYLSQERVKKDIDNYDTREKMKMLHILVRHGARWEPQDRHDISRTRSSLLKMASHYTMEFIWIMAGYNACDPANIRELMKRPDMRSLVSQYSKRFTELMESFSNGSKDSTQ